MGSCPYSAIAAFGTSICMPQVESLKISNTPASGQKQCRSGYLVYYTCSTLPFLPCAAMLGGNEPPMQLILDSSIVLIAYLISIAIGRRERCSSEDMLLPRVLPSLSTSLSEFDLEACNRSPPPLREHSRLQCLCSRTKYIRNDAEACYAPRLYYPLSFTGSLKTSFQTPPSRPRPCRRNNQDIYHRES